MPVNLQITLIKRVNRVMLTGNVDIGLEYEKLHVYSLLWLFLTVLNTYEEPFFNNAYACWWVLPTWNLFWFWLQVIISDAHINIRYDSIYFALIAEMKIFFPYWNIASLKMNVIEALLWKLLFYFSLLGWQWRDWSAGHPWSRWPAGKFYHVLYLFFFLDKKGGYMWVKWEVVTSI